MKLIKTDRIEALMIALIIILALFLRFYNIAGYMTFLGDEGRDALVIQGILVNHHLPLLGPPTSVGNMYLGPLYYYMMAIPMAIFWLNPVAAAGMDAVIGVLTVLLIYYLGRVWFGKYSAFLAAMLYAISPVTIVYSKSSWNPNPAPFFALLAFVGFYRARESKNFHWLILVGGALAAAAQMHYLALILLPIFGILWLLEWKTKEKKNFGHGTILAIITFLIVMSPLFLFDIRHNFMNFRALKEFLLTNNGSVHYGILDNLMRFLPIYNNDLIYRYMAGQQLWLSLILSVMIIGVLVWATLKKGVLKNYWSYLALGIWLIVGLLGLSFYHNAIYDHYLGFMNPAPYLILGGLIYFLKDKLQTAVCLSLFVVLGFFNFKLSPLQYPPNNQLERTQEVTKFIINQTDAQPFNFALLSANNYDSAYQFYFGRFGDPPMQVPFNITKQLFVVCEDQNCQPINNPKYEIAGFGLSKIEYEKDFNGVKVYKLVANPGGKPR